jgi:murein DD-endopeptidase MepM/ murein hydrolase activator NlpD
MTLGKRSIAAIWLGAAMALCPSALAANTGGTVEFTSVPVVKSVRCVALCAGKTRVQATGAIKLTGKRLDDVKFVVFHGSDNTKNDNVAVNVRSTKERVLRVTVPINAESGLISVWKTETAGSEPGTPIQVLPPPPPEDQAKLAPASGPRQPGAPRLETGVSTTKAFFAGNKVRFSYRLNAEEPVPVHIELINVAEELVVRSWDPGAMEPGVVHTIKWNGKAAKGLRANAGRYIWRLTAQDSDGLTSKSAGNTDPRRDAFDFYGHIFPIRGKHNYGQSGARFGAGRSGHSHQGQDVFARCGTKMVAARAGTVRYNAYHGAAGYYLVVDGYKSDFDYVYMHLQKRSAWKPGDKIKTGQRIGKVGDSGNASGCHLHYEMWKGGWYDGGSPMDPYSYLKSWDSWS